MGPRRPRVPGGDGYAGMAQELAARYDAIAFEDKHAVVLDLLPRHPCDVLDIGAGTGADAAWLADRGHRVVAVEPTAQLRRCALRLHPSRAIQWVDDSLPDLATTFGLRRRFELVMITAVWMHLQEAERSAAMRRVASLLPVHGRLVMSLRHGPLPAGRRMFEVSADETVTLARQQALRTILNTRTASCQDANRRAGVEWSRLAFERAP